MEALDGNAIAGVLFEWFGTEMTVASGACRHCGAQGLIAELRVYLRAPGAVARCRSCGGVVIVATERGGEAQVTVEGFKLSA